MNSAFFKALPPTNEAFGAESGKDLRIKLDQMQSSREMVKGAQTIDSIP